MRHVKRKSRAIPPVLDSSTAREYQREVDRYLASGTVETRPPRPPELLFEDRLLKRSLHEQFRDACAYCETPLESGSGEVDHFRPLANADRGDGRIDYRHYCWLAVEWENLYLACDACLRGKRSFFPIRGESPISAPIHELLRVEEPVLLDPCYDHPALDLAVQEDGLFAGTSDRGSATIDILHLNRPDLIHARRRVLAQLEQLLSGGNDESDQWLAQQAGEFFDHSPFKGSIYMALLQRLPAAHVLNNWRREPADAHRAGRLAESAAPPGIRGRQEQGHYRRVEMGERRYLRRVTIKNFRGVRNAVVEFPQRGKGSGKGPGSLAILGENASGKTSILQATAVGALGPDKAHQAGIHPADCLNDDAHEGFVQVEFWDTDDINLVRFRRSSGVFSGHASVENTVLGYGAYRLPARGLLGRRKRGTQFRVQSLFQEREYVNGTFGLELHFGSPEGTDRIADATRALNALLTETAQARLSQTDIVIEEKGRRQRLRDLSSGFKSVVSMATDIMDVMYESWGGISSGQALVLVDEIDAHLHPEWRLRVVRALREAFPLSQFMLTTHDPLVLRGLARQEIRLLDGREGMTTAVEEPRIADTDALTVDQMLTSDLFGLDTTMDPETARDLRDYYRLISRPLLDEDEQLRRDALADRLQLTLPMGTTRRERLLYAVIDRYLARTASNRAADVWDEAAVEELVREFEAAEQELDEENAGDDQGPVVR